MTLSDRKDAQLLDFFIQATSAVYQAKQKNKQNNKNNKKKSSEGYLCSRQCPVENHEGSSTKIDAFVQPRKSHADQTTWDKKQVAGTQLFVCARYRAGHFCNKPSGLLMTQITSLTWGWKGPDTAPSDCPVLPRPIDVSRE